MTDAERKLKNLVWRLYRSSATGSRLLRVIKREVRHFVADEGLALTFPETDKLVREMLRSIDAKSFAEFSRTQGGGDLLVAQQSIVTGFSFRLDGIDRIASSAIVKAITAGRETGKPWRETAQDVLVKAGSAAHHAVTEIETTMGAMDRAAALQNAIDAGITKFRYEGPSGTDRAFCSGRVNNIYTIEEINSMSNGQGLPVRFYMGGYNCRHRWEPYYERILK